MELKNCGNVKNKRRGFHQNSHLFSYSEEAEHMLIRDIAAGDGHSSSGQGCSSSVSELKLSKESLPYLSSSLDADLEMCNKKRIRPQVDESKVEADTLGRACDDTHCKCRACDEHNQSGLGEDSQLEYLSAHEQEFDDRSNSSESSEQKETIGMEATKLIDAVYEVPGAGFSKDHNLVALSKDCSASEHGIAGQTFPELPHLLQDSLTDFNGVTCDPREEQTWYHSTVCGSILESDSWGSKERVYPNLLVSKSLEKGKVKDILLIDGTLTPQITLSEVSEKNDRCHSQHVTCHDSISVKQENPLLPPRERAQTVALQCREHAENSDFSCEGSDVSVHGASCIDTTARGADIQFSDSEILTSRSPFFGVEGADKSLHGNTSCLNTELEHHETLEKNLTGGSTVNQMVDASSDFRAYFTTSRSTSAQVCLSSRAVNTVITMMNKSLPLGWHCVDVACNTEWSCGSGSTEKMCLQLTEMLENHSDGKTATAERSSQIQEHHESKNELCSSSLKISTVRPVHLDKQAVNNSAASYIQEILQRAIEAELQILRAHYKMCYQHCWKIYSLALEQNACFGRCNGNTELRSTVMLVLEELKKKYESMRKQIKSGTPLNALAPLSVEIKLLQISSFYDPSKLFQEDLCHDSVSGTREAGFEALKLQEWKISVNMDDPQIVCLTDVSQPSDSNSSKTSEEQHKNQDMECGCVKNEEEIQYCFDAKEDLTVADFSVIPEENKKKEKQDTIDLQEAKITKSGNEHPFICGDGPSSSVSEDTGENILQKTSALFSTNSYDACISPNKLNLSSFINLMKKLQEIHPEASRDKIVNALLEVKYNNNGILSGLPISSIVDRTSVILRKSSPSCGWEKQHK